MKNIEQQIQLMVDNELDASTSSKLLNVIERETPEHWRTLALAYSEAQILRNSFLALANEKAGLEKDLVKKSYSPLFKFAAMLLLGLMLGYLISPQKTAKKILVDTKETNPTEVEDVQMIEDFVAFGESNMQLPIYDAVIDPDKVKLAVSRSATGFNRAKTIMDRPNSRSLSSTAYISADLEDGSEIMIPVTYQVNLPEQ